MKKDSAVIVFSVLVAFLPVETVHAESFVTFESGQVRPLALSLDKKKLFVLNTPDNRLEIFNVRSSGLTRTGSVLVGLEPVALAIRDNREVWVVNHLSDSISIVDVESDPPRVVGTLLVGDEPRDIVFAGPGLRRAFITTAHRGQNNPNDPQLTIPSVGRADVWVFDTLHLGRSLEDSPLNIITLYGDTPRALAVSPDGRTVYAAVFLSGNRTTVIHEKLIPNGGEALGGLPHPNTNFQGIPQTEVGLIVKFNGIHWLDELGRTWDHAVNFSLPDKDVFVINAMADTPVEVNSFSGVGTVLFNIVVNPVSGTLYVANTEAFNESRFSGPGHFAGHTVRGHLTESRITVINHSGVFPRHLNKHINYAVTPGPRKEIKKSMAFPMGMAVTRDGKLLYVAAFGSSKVGVFNTDQIENDTFTPDRNHQITVTGGGPSGLVLDETRGRLYVLTRFDNSISVIDTLRRREVAHIPLYNPEPASVIEGRRFLYDASNTSGHGDSACASCHIFGDLDGLAWDLGDPDGTELKNPGPFVVKPDPIFGTSDTFHPMKGPMTTQSLRGLAKHGPMHWRGDRTGGNDAPSFQPDSGAFDEVAAFKQFNGAFVDLMGRKEPLASNEIQAFTDFALQITYPPNPVRSLDNTLTSDQQAGHDIFFGTRPFLLGITCGGCHVLDKKVGFFGTDGRSAADAFKIPHMRNLYQKVGMFGLPPMPFFNPGDNDFRGDQIRGFGFTHDGSVDTIFRHHTSVPFSKSEQNPTGFIPDAENHLIRQIEQFLLAFDSNLAPIVGQQVTLTSKNGAVSGPRIDLLISRSEIDDPVRECDLVVYGNVMGRQQKWFRGDDGLFYSNRFTDSPLTDSELRSKALFRGQELTYTCLPPNS